MEKKYFADAFFYKCLHCHKQAIGKAYFHVFTKAEIHVFRPRLGLSVCQRRLGSQRRLGCGRVHDGVTCANALQITARVIPMRRSVLQVTAWVRLWLCLRPVDWQTGIFRSTRMAVHELAIRSSATGLSRTCARRRSGS